MKLFTKSLLASALALSFAATTLAATDNNITVNSQNNVNAQVATSTVASKTASDKADSATPAYSQEQQTTMIKEYAVIALDNLQKELGLSKEEIKTFAEAAMDYANGKASISDISDEEKAKIGQYLSERGAKIRLARAETEGKAAMEAGKKAFEQFMKRDGAMKDASGLAYIIEQQGTGAQVKDTDTVSVLYTGKLPDGTVFDSNEATGNPVSFPLNGVIPGFKLALTKLKVGGKIDALIPANLAYGEQGIPGVIPPNSTLEFVITVTDTKPASATPKK